MFGVSLGSLGELMGPLSGLTVALRALGKAFGVLWGRGAGCISPTKKTAKKTVRLGNRGAWREMAGGTGCNNQNGKSARKSLYWGLCRPPPPKKKKKKKKKKHPVRSSTVPVRSQYGPVRSQYAVFLGFNSVCRTQYGHPVRPSTVQYVSSTVVLGPKTTVLETYWNVLGFTG